MSKFWYLVSFSLKKRIKTKSFLIANIILGIILIGLINLPSIIKAFGGDFNDTKTYLVYDKTDKAYDYMIEANDEEKTYIKLELKTTEFDKENIDYEGNEGIIVLYFNDSNILTADIYAKDISLTSETNLTNLANIAKTKIWEETATQEIKDSINDLLEPIVITKNLEVKDSSKVEKSMLGALATVILLPVFIFIVMLMQFVGTDIMEEKSSRSIEYIISNVEPVKHFGSKIISSILFVIVQFLIMLAFGGIGLLIAKFAGGGFTESLNSLIGNGAEAAATTDAISSITKQVPSMLLAIGSFAIFGYALYLVLIAIFASMTTSMEDFQQFQTPVMLMLLVSFYVGISASLFEGSVFIKILGYIPFFSPMLAPILFINGSFVLYEVIISAVILIITDVLVIYFGIPVYRVSILSYSQDKFFTRIKKLIKNSRYKD